MARNLVKMTIAMYVFTCSSVLFAQQPKVDSAKNEIREITRLLAELNTRVKRLEERIAATDQEAEPDEARNGNLLWQLFGVRLEEVNLDYRQRTVSRYRGGMRVVAVRSEGPAARQSIQEGEIVVGIHAWETVHEENVNFILASDALRQNKAVKFYIVRNGETLQLFENRAKW